MNRKLFLITVSVLLIFVVACDFGNMSIDLFGSGDSGSGAGGGAVEVGIDAPANGASLPMGPVEIAYHANSLDGVASIELSVDGQVVSSITSPDTDQKVVALRYTWQPNVSGSHTLRVRAQSNKGVWSEYVSATINIQGDSNPPAQQQDQQAAPVEEKPTDTPEATNTPDTLTIFDVEKDRDKFYYKNGSCGSREITISAKVTHPDQVTAMVLFTRFFDDEGGGTTKWDGGKAMSKKSDDTYSVTMESKNIQNYNVYEFTVMNYQIVAQDKSGGTSVRTEVFKDIEMDICP